MAKDKKLQYRSNLACFKKFNPIVNDVPQASGDILTFDVFESLQQNFGLIGIILYFGNFRLTDGEI
jgi:hypothetical protein